MPGRRSRLLVSAGSPCCPILQEAVVAGCYRKPKLRRLSPVGRSTGRAGGRRQLPRGVEASGVAPPSRHQPALVDTSRPRQSGSGRQELRGPPRGMPSDIAAGRLARRTRDDDQRFHRVDTGQPRRPRRPHRIRLPDGPIDARHPGGGSRGRRGGGGRGRYGRALEVTSSQGQMWIGLKPAARQARVWGRSQCHGS
jgi:hypothetical protein